MDIFKNGDFSCACGCIARTIEKEVFFTIWFTVHTLTNENGASENDDIITLQKSLQSNVSVVFRHNHVKTFVWTENLLKQRIQKCPFSHKNDGK